MAAGHAFELWLRARVDLRPGTGARQRWVGVEAAEPIASWKVGVVLLRILGRVYEVQVCESGECVLLSMAKGTNREQRAETN